MMHLSPDERRRFAVYEAMIEVVRNHAAYLSESRDDPTCKELFAALDKAGLCISALMIPTLTERA